MREGEEGGRRGREEKKEGEGGKGGREGPRRGTCTTKGTGWRERVRGRREGRGERRASARMYIYIHVPNPCTSYRQQRCCGDFLLLRQFVILFRLLSPHLWQ